MYFKQYVFRCTHVHGLHGIICNLASERLETEENSSEQLVDEADEAKVQKFWSTKYFSNEPFVVGLVDKSPVRSEDEDVSAMHLWLSSTV